MKIGDKVRILVWQNTTGEYVLGLNKGDYVYGVIHQIINDRIYVKFDHGRIYPCSTKELEFFYYT
jgi:hypothetical protein